MKSRVLRALVVCAALSPAATYVVFAAISLSTSSAANQNFDGMGIPTTTTSTSTVPTDFRVDNPSAVRTVGTFAAAVTTTARNGGANLSSSASNGIYNFGAGTAALGNSDRAIGFLSSGTATGSGNLYAQYTNNTGADLSGLKVSYDVEKYRLGINTAGFCVQLYSSSNGTAWTSAGAPFLTAFAGDPTAGGNAGYATVPGAMQSIANQTLNVPVANGATVYLAWNYSVCSGTTTSNAQALAIDNISILGIGAGNSTNPTGTMSANAQTYGMGLSPQLLPLWIAHEVAHALRYTSPSSRAAMRRLIGELGGYYDAWELGSRASLRELVANEGVAIAASQAVAPGFDPWEYFGYNRRQYRRLRELDAFLRRASAGDLDSSGLGLRLRYLSGGMSPAARLLAGKVLPERSGYYLGLRLVENYFAEHGAASTVRAAVEELRQADDRASGIQTA